MKSRRCSATGLVPLLRGIRAPVDEVEEAQEFFRQKLGDKWKEALLSANAVARLHEPIPEAVAAQLRAVNLVGATRRNYHQNLRDQSAEAWQVLWLHDALP